MKTMRTTMKSLLYAAGIALLATACSNDNEPEVADLTKPIDLSFSLGESAATRVGIAASDVQFEDNDKVGVFLATHPTDASSLAPINTTGGTSVNNVPFTKAGSKWNGTIYWQDITSYHSFHAYSPYNDGLDVSASPQIDINLASDQHASSGKGYKDADYLYGNNGMPLRATASGVPQILMQHKMARIKIELTKGTDVTDQEVDDMAASLKIKGTMFSAGKFDVKDGSISGVSGSHSEITPYREGSNGAYQYYAILFPTTTFQKGDDFVTLYLNDTPYIYKLNINTGNQLMLVAGNEYTFKLQANKAGITLQQFGIEAWTPIVGDDNGGADMEVN